MTIAPGMGPNAGLAGAMGGGWREGLSTVSPLLLAMGGDMLRGTPGASTQQGLAAMMQMQERQRAKQEKEEQRAQQGIERARALATAGVPLEQGAIIQQMEGARPGSGMGALFEQRYGKQGGAQPALVQEYEYARQNGFQGSFLDYQQSRNSRDNVGLSPIFGTDAQGNPVIMQTTSSGEVVRSAMPEGVNISRDPIRIDAGNGTVILDPITRQQIGFVPKDARTPAAESAAGTVEGRAQAERRAGAPAALRTATETLAIIDGVLDDPQLDNALGFGGYSFVPDVSGFNTGPRARIAQLQGRAFLEAFESLKGAGQITEIEGQKAQEAIARLRTTQTPEEFKAAVEELRGIVIRGKERAQRLAIGQSAFEAESAVQGESISSPPAGVSPEEWQQMLGVMSPEDRALFGGSGAANPSPAADQGGALPNRVNDVVGAAEQGKPVAPITLARAFTGANETKHAGVIGSFIERFGGSKINPAETAWCAAFVNAVLGASGSEGTGRLNARSFLDWGQPVEQPQQGDVAVLWRESPDSWKGHVGFFAGYEERDGKRFVRLVGGNQDNGVNEKLYPAEQLLGFRRA